jgi:hypothetical protein
MTTWTPADIQVTWIAPLWRGGVPYELKVFGAYADGNYDVEVYVEGDFCGTKTIVRNTHVIADMYDFVERCIASHDDILFNDAETLSEGI